MFMKHEARTQELVQQFDKEKDENISHSFIIPIIIFNSFSPLDMTFNKRMKAIAV